MAAPPSPPPDATSSPDAGIHPEPPAHPRANTIASPSAATLSAGADEQARLRQTAAQLVPMFYADLRRLARRVRYQAQASETLQTTALIHEVYLKLQATTAWNDHQHFMRAAAMAMRQVLIDDVRARLAQRRGAGAVHLPLEAAEAVAAVDDDERVLAVDDALERLAAMSPRLAQTVECRYFAGYTENETADALGLSVATVQRDWAKARAWLHRELTSPPAAP
jgi:RNA polymerase sigma factor (TIGR02999 family)